jgi:hypothetical protein
MMTNTLEEKVGVDSKSPKHWLPQPVPMRQNPPTAQSIASSGKEGMRREYRMLYYCLPLNKSQNSLRDPTRQEKLTFS